MDCTFFWVKVGNAFTYFGFVYTGQMALLFNTNIQTEYILIAIPNCALEVPGRQEKYIFYHKKDSIYKVYSTI